MAVRICIPLLTQVCFFFLLLELDIFQWDKHQFAEKTFTIPEHYDTLERIDYAKVSREEFIERFEEKNLPVVIRGVMEGWGACKNWNSEVK